MYNIFIYYTSSTESIKFYNCVYFTYITHTIFTERSIIPSHQPWITHKFLNSDTFLWISLQHGLYQPFAVSREPLWFIVFTALKHHINLHSLRDMHHFYKTLIQLMLQHFSNCMHYTATLFG